MEGMQRAVGIFQKMTAEEKQSLNASIAELSAANVLITSGDLNRSGLRANYERGDLAFEAIRTLILKCGAHIIPEEWRPFFLEQKESRNKYSGSRWEIRWDEGSGVDSDGVTQNIMAIGAQVAVENQPMRLTEADSLRRALGVEQAYIESRQSQRFQQKAGNFFSWLWRGMVGKRFVRRQASEGVERVPTATAVPLLVDRPKAITPQHDGKRAAARQKSAEVSGTVRTPLHAPSDRRRTAESAV
ncbi:MAG: hypothetical protein V4490_02945 [Pseudomonadota bacterium]